MKKNSGGTAVPISRQVPSGVATGGYKPSHYTQVASHRKMQAFLTDERHHELGS